MGGGGQIFQLKVRFYDFDFHGLNIFLEAESIFFFQVLARFGVKKHEINNFLWVQK